MMIPFDQVASCPCASSPPLPVDPEPTAPLRVMVLAGVSQVKFSKFLEKVAEKKTQEFQRIVFIPPLAENSWGRFIDSIGLTT